MRWMEEWPAEIVRAKGVLWLATRNDTAQSFSQAGPSIQIGPAGYWVAALPEPEREMILQENKELAASWDPALGDRINKVVFIGIDMDQHGIVTELDRCLLTEEEMKQDWGRIFRSVSAGGRRTCGYVCEMTICLQTGRKENEPD